MICCRLRRPASYWMVPPRTTKAIFFSCSSSKARVRCALAIRGSMLARSARVPCSARTTSASAAWARLMLSSRCARLPPPSGNSQLTPTDQPRCWMVDGGGVVLLFNIWLTSRSTFGARVAATLRTRSRAAAARSRAARNCACCVSAFSKACAGSGANVKSANCATGSKASASSLICAARRSVSKPSCTSSASSCELCASSRSTSDALPSSVWRITCFTSCVTSRKRSCDCIRLRSRRCMSKYAWPAFPRFPPWPAPRRRRRPPFRARPHPFRCRRRRRCTHSSAGSLPPGECAVARPARHRGHCCARAWPAAPQSGTGANAPACSALRWWPAPPAPRLLADHAARRAPARRASRAWIAPGKWPAVPVGPPRLRRRTQCKVNKHASTLLQGGLQAAQHGLEHILHHRAASRQDTHVDRHAGRDRQHLAMRRQLAAVGAELHLEIRLVALVGDGVGAHAHHLRLHAAIGGGVIREHIGRGALPHMDKADIGRLHAHGNEHLGVGRHDFQDGLAGLRHAADGGHQHAVDDAIDGRRDVAPTHLILLAPDRAGQGAGLGFVFAALRAPLAAHARFDFAGLRLRFGQGGQQTRHGAAQAVEFRALLLHALLRVQVVAARTGALLE